MFIRSHDYRVDINFEITKVSIPAIYKNKRIDIPFFIQKEGKESGNTL
ncbi:hypothetical protein [Catenibacterium faecis]|uniref:Uncharacterized protein n=1 Tax=Catenibacterium faecis TaxID=2764323 RepID=A0ABR7KEK5_9FIRM|nr:hypothetical protein [Catenibacterium faecis]MBC6010886.1 hypothetical protein [Catenibacterium faecis]